ncbi:MAG: hypothetical protein HPY69_10395 [Armatimonadetes bacterium]|nr:hypothetical protein [Armatimonadota bacterium]
MASAESLVDERLSHHRQAPVWVLAGLTHLGLLAICCSAAYTLQPADFTGRQWAALLLAAVIALAHAVGTRGRGAASVCGKSLTALLAGVALSLSYDPQLASWPTVGERMPLWLAAVNPSLATIGVLVAGVFGMLYLATVTRRCGQQCPIPYARVTVLAAALVIVLGLGTYAALGRIYDMDSLHLVMLVSNAVQYAWLLGVVLGLSGRTGVGYSAQVYLALTVLAALVRNLVGGGEPA